MFIFTSIESKKIERENRSTVKMIADITEKDNYQNCFSCVFTSKEKGPKCIQEIIYKS